MRTTALTAIEILDSRGNPTVEVTLVDERNRRFGASVPSGASTGSREAVELRDGNPDRYSGRGVLAAVGAVNTEIAALLTSRDWADLPELDDAVRSLDGTPTKSRLGANAIVGVSMAAARAFAADSGVELFEYLASNESEIRLPMPHFNVLNGGAHARNPLEFQEFMIAPLGAPTYPEALRWGAEVYAALRSGIAAEGLSTGLGDEGGFAPDIADPHAACALIVSAIEAAGFTPGPEGVAIALDPAANGFFHNGGYRVSDRSLTPGELVDLYSDLVAEFPIWSLEDGCAEGDDAGWALLTERLGTTTQLVGDDIFVTDPATIAAAADAGFANAALIKVNQIGTVTETLATLRTCRERGYAAMISHRSGETTDTFIADLAVGSGCGQIKSGAPARGERVAKYNRLLGIDASTPDLAFGIGR